VTESASPSILLGLSGALRAGSVNRKLIREAARLFQPGTQRTGEAEKDGRRGGFGHGKVS
jgi:hypothetical protein